MVDQSAVSSDVGDIYITRLANAQYMNTKVQWSSKHRIPFTKYNIKESDWRVKTATFSSPSYLDLTTGQHAVLIKSKYHENFTGIVLDVEYDEQNGIYNYQCQDWSRRYMDTMESIIKGDVTLYNYLMHLLSGAAISLNPTTKEKNKYKTVLSGLRKIGLYDQALYKGNIYNGNPMTGKPKFIVRNKPIVEIIRDLMYSQLGFFDIWFNDKGVLQVEPLSKTDWETTGLHLTDKEFANRKFKFSTTNVITGVGVNGEGTSLGKTFTTKDLLGLDLSAFFGNVTTGIDNPNKSSASKKSSNAVSTNNTIGKDGNPFNNKAKKIMVCADGGSGSYMNKIVSILQREGWSCTVLGEGPSYHSIAYQQVDSSYAANLVICNGFCVGSIRECYDGWLKGSHERKGVQLIYMFDTSSWTNRRGMYPYRYGDFHGADIERAWDDNFSAGDPAIHDVEGYLIKYKVCYCCGPTPEEAMEQFRAGGYLRMKGLI